MIAKRHRLKINTDHWPLLSAVPKGSLGDNATLERLLDNC
jgi:hypothetical protein